MEITTVKHDVPLPLPKTGKKEKKINFPFPDMNIGSSFIIKLDVTDFKNTAAVRTIVRNEAKSYSIATRANFKIATRVVTDGLFVYRKQ